VTASPFAATLGPFEAALPRVFREQFLLAGGRVALEGKVQRVWRRHRWLRPVFAALARADILFPETGSEIPAVLVIEPCAAGHSWCRGFRFGRVRRFDATLAFDARSNRVIELFGPRGFLAFVWEVRFRPPGRVEVWSSEALLRVRGRRIPLPRWLAVQGRAVEVATPAGDGLRIELVVSHPWLGPVFGYHGEFRLRALD
jgi:hypothetical protein